MNPQHLPIAVFDSGIGGLTNARALRKLLPAEALLYFGDTAHLPYGDKSPETLRGYIREIVDYVLGQQVKAVVIACNTASAVAYDEVVAMCGDLPVFEVISPAVETALKRSATGRIGVIGTKTTIQSHIYLRSILHRQPDALVVEKATPLLVPMIEEGWAGGKIAEEVIEAYMSDTGFAHIDTLILGCTHYPLVQDQIQQYFDTNLRHKVQVINSADALAERVSGELGRRGLLNPETFPKVGDRFCVSDLTESFGATARIFFGGEIALQRVTLQGQ